MQKNRLEAFSDGVLAIVITIMVLELKVPHGSDLHALTPLIPVFLSYILSFLYIGIYWNNHHHLLHATRHINGRVLWANLHLLFWLSLLPFSTGWMGENHFNALPTAIYGINLAACAVAYWLLVPLPVPMKKTTPCALPLAVTIKACCRWPVTVWQSRWRFTTSGFLS